MSKRAARTSEEVPYVRGDFWLQKRGKGDNWYIWRYNPERGTDDYWSTRTSDLIEACKALDLRFLAANDQAHAFCHHCGQKMPDGRAYLLLQAIRDYKIEYAHELPSYEPIRSRCHHIVRFCLEHLEREDVTCAEATTETFVKTFREWLQPQPVVWRNKAGEITSSAPRTVSSVEESVHQLKAVLNYAVVKKRSDEKPTFKTKARKTVSPPVRTRASLDILTDMVDYAREYEKRSALYRFLIASICTAARPDAIYDMNVRPDRYQWQRQERLFDLNPFGRVQTKKYRPLLPVIGPMEALLKDAEKNSPDGWVIHYFGKPVIKIRSAWRTMVEDLNLPGGREWGSYLIRRTMATLLRQRGANPWDVEGLLGHRIAGTTEIYSHDTLFTTARQGIEDILADMEGRLGSGALDISMQVRCKA